jgi:hypothetical protein
MVIGWFKILDFLSYLITIKKTIEINARKVIEKTIAKEKKASFRTKTFET